jgi:23S rRNA (adenine2030-N6)-methyltransferase
MLRMVPLPRFAGEDHVNYRHAFHAGNFADVMKHAILARLIDYLKKKPGAFRIIDTHAGTGRYDLTGDEAQRSPEWRDGIARLLDADPAPDAAALLAPYLDAVRALNPGTELKTYPGSPLLARMLLRPQDRLSALELHPADAEALKALFAGDIQARVSQLDGWLALGAYVPPKERRGLVLVDPPFEAEGEWERLADGLAKAHRKWATGMFALWYPLKERREAEAFARRLRDAAIPRTLRAELTVAAPADPSRLYGSGMVVVNPPFTLEAELGAMLPELARILGGPAGGFRIEWISGEG